MNPIESVEGRCPWCDARLELDLDLTGGSGRYVEDCHVCCQPVLVSLEIEPTDGAFRVSLTREGE